MATKIAIPCIWDPDPISKYLEGTQKQKKNIDFL